MENPKEPHSAEKEEKGHARLKALDQCLRQKCGGKARNAAQKKAQSGGE